MLALELTLRGAGSTLDFEEAARRAGLELDDAARLWRALGFADPEAGEARLSEQDVLALGGLARAGRELFGEQRGLGLARVVGATAGRLADALVNSVRVEFEMPQRAAGVAYSEVVAGYVELAEQQLDGFVTLFGIVFRRHLLAVAQASWSFDDQALAARRQLVVAFVDMVGYTALSRTLAPRDLAALLETFETSISDAVTRHGGRLVKLIGDGAMVTADTAPRACRLALDLVARFREDPATPEVRVGLACGSVIALQGDYFGDVVNLAARLVVDAAPSTVIVSEDLPALAGDEFAFAPLPPSDLKGLARTERAQLLARAPAA